MITCKNCKSEHKTKSGTVNNKQRYKCKDCGYHYVEGDGRTNDKVAAKKALCVLLYSLGKASFRMLAKIFDTNQSLVYRWIVEAGAKLPEPRIDNDITEIEFDEMWHFVKAKKTSYGLSKHLTVAQGELSPGYSVVVMLKHSPGSTIN